MQQLMIKIRFQRIIPKIITKYGNVEQQWRRWWLREAMRVRGGVHWTQISYRACALGRKCLVARYKQKIKWRKMIDHICMTFLLLQSIIANSLILEVDLQLPNGIWQRGYLFYGIYFDFMRIRLDFYFSKAYCCLRFNFQHDGRTHPQCFRMC